MREWFLDIKLPDPILSNPVAMGYWEEALKDPTPGKIYKFWCMSGCDRYLPRLPRLPREA